MNTVFAHRTFVTYSFVVARPFVLVQHALKRLSLQGPVHGRGRQRLGVRNVLDVRHDHAVERVAHLRHVVRIAAVRAGQTGDALRVQRVLHRQEVGDVQRVVLRGDDHEVERARWEEIDECRAHRVLEERAEHAVALDQLVLQNLAAHDGPFR